MVPSTLLRECGPSTVYGKNRPWQMGVTGMPNDIIRPTGHFAFASPGFNGSGYIYLPGRTYKATTSLHSATSYYIIFLPSAEPSPPQPAFAGIDGFGQSLSIRHG